MSHTAFLELLQTVESLRLCEGRECMVVTDLAMFNAATADAAQVAHPPASSHEADLSLVCPECRTVADKRNALREVLRAQGVTLPTGLLEP